MTNFEKITASPEALGQFLAALPVPTGPWDEQFHRQFCDGCKQTCNHCQHEDVRNNPTWWLNQADQQEAMPETPPAGKPLRFRNGRLQKD